jgi:hypothetical protein
MLGCQDFCGYYDWTFDHIRGAWGAQAAHDFWASAIGGESQAHYLRAALADGLRGLLHTWNKTGSDEHCDWTFTLDETKNVLRWDMRSCPSKGFLLANNLNADEDYCDHCMGWIVPLLTKAGVEVAAHEHNHCGQCWAEMRVKGKPHQTVASDAPDIRSDARWRAGYIDRWNDGVKASADPCDVLTNWFDRAEKPTIVATSASYIDGDACENEPTAVVIENRPSPEHLDALARRISASSNQITPLLMFAYLPGGGANAVPAFEAHGLPRPVPVLPLLIRRRVYRHEPDQPPPTAAAFIDLLAFALSKSP